MENKRNIDYILNSAKLIINEEVEKAGYKTEAVYLFGSRARGDYKEDSDWDFYVVVNKNMERDIKIKVSGDIRRGMRNKLKISADILIQPLNIVNERKNKSGYVTYFALKEGLPV